MPETSSFALVSPTALSVAYLRAQSGIPYTSEIAEMTSAREVTAELAGGEEHLAAMTHAFQAWAELRFKALSAAIKDAQGVLELAAGFSPRGLIFAETNPDTLYVSTDLEGVHDARMNVLGRVAQNHPKNRRLLWYRIVDAMNRREVVESAKCFRGRGRVAIINEGLLGYCSYDQKLQIATNICELLKATGGMWFTTDIHTIAEHERIQALSDTYLGNFEKKVKRSFKDNAFADLNEAERLMDLAGLRVERYDQKHFVPLEELRSAIPDDQVWKMLHDQHLWIMALK